jgi:putative addiction module component (TIGR02574 family)
MPPTRLVIPPALLADVIAHCRAGLPNEAGGLLAGRDGVAERHFPLRNQLASPTRFLSDPADTIAAAKACRLAGLDVVCVYHSHPTTDPVPSPRDRDEWYADSVPTLIVGLAGAEPDVRAWVRTATGFVPVAGSGIVAGKEREPMPNTVDLDAIRALPPEERRVIADVIRESLEDDVPPLTEAQAAELDRRLEQYRADPTIGVPLEVIEREIEREEAEEEA